MTQDKHQKKYSLLIIGGSAGSLEVLLMLVAGLKPLHMPIVIVVHRKEDNDSVLVELLSSRGSFPVKEAEDKETIVPGTIYIAPPDYHLLIEKNNSFSLDLSDRVNFSRPSIDVSFETAADALGEGLVALLLSGANADGAAGLEKVKAFGGLVIVQDPSSAEVSYMPKHAIETMEPDFIIAAPKLAGFINDLMSA